MGKIFYIMGQSSTGKDTIYKHLMKDEDLNLCPIVLYTTRPIRDGEQDGVQYHFVDESCFREFEEKGSVIESRVYHTVHGDWRYFTVDDENIDLANNSYIAIGTLESYVEFCKYYEKGVVIPILIEVEDGERLSRALQRELRPENRKFKEMCRRFLADSEDFSEEKIILAGLGSENRFENKELESCTQQIKNYILLNM